MKDEHVEQVNGCSVSVSGGAYGRNKEVRAIAKWWFCDKTSVWLVGDVLGHSSWMDLNLGVWMHLLLALGGLLGQQNVVDVRDDTTLCDRRLAEQLVQLLVVADGQLDVTRHDALLLVVA